MSESGARGIDRRTVIAAGGVAAVAVVSGCGGASTPAAVSGQVLASTADVPIGGGVISSAAKIVITQPSEGDIRAFTAVCPHQGCLVADVIDNVIVCPCHASSFSASDGSVISGPAMEPLSPALIAVEGSDIVLA